MAEEVGFAFVSILPSLKGFSSRLKSELRGELRTIDPVVGEAGDRAGRTFGSRMRSSLGSVLPAIGSMLKTALTAGIAAAVIGLGALTAFGLKSAAALEQTTIGLEALTGSAEVAAGFLKELQDFSAKTPFEFAGVADASRRILAFGNAVGITRQQVIPTLTVIGDLVSVLGGSQENIDSVVRALGQMASKGKLSQEELLQLAEALPGFNANAAIASSMGLSVADTLKKITAGEIDAKTGINALLVGMAKFPGAAGAMAKQSQTLTGVFSTFKDTMSIALTDAFTPVIPAIKEALTGLTPVIGQAVSVLAPALGEFLSKMLPLIGGLITALSPILGTFVDLAGTIVSTLAPAFEPLGAVVKDLVDGLSPLAVVIGEVLGEAIRSFVPVIAALVPQMVQLVPPFMDLLLALLPILPPLGQLLALVIQLEAPLVQILAVILSWLAIKALTPAISFLAGALGKLLGFLLPIANVILDLSNWPMLFGLFVDKVRPFLDQIVGWFQALPDKIAAGLAALPGRLKASAQTALQEMAFAVGFGIGTVIKFFRDLPGTLLALAGQAWEFVKARFTSGVSDARNAASAGLDRVVADLKALPGRIISALAALPGQLASFGANLASEARSLGGNIIDGLIAGVKAAAGKVVSAVVDTLKAGIAGGKKALGIASPSVVFAGIGEQAIAGYVQGIRNAAADARAATASALAPATAAAGGGLGFGQGPSAPVIDTMNVNAQGQSAEEVAAVVIREISWAQSG